QDVVTAVVGLQQDDVRGRRAAIGLDGGRDAAHLHAQVRLGEPAIVGRCLHRGGGLDTRAEGLDGDARRRRGGLLALGGLGRRRGRRLGGLEGIFHATCRRR